MKAKSRRCPPSDRRYPHLPVSASLAVLAAAGVLTHGAAVLAAPPVGVRTPTFALPTGPATQTQVGIVGNNRPIYAPVQIVPGTAGYTVGTVNGRLTATVTQNNNAGILQWDSFDIGTDAAVSIVQPSTTSILLNRVTGGWYGAGQQTVIEGMLNSTLAGSTVPGSGGQVYILNPNGIVFGKTARIDVNGLVASTLNIDNNRFLNGLTAASQSPFFAATSAPGAIVVEGETGAQAQINAADGGLILLVAPNVTNQGKITAPNGQVILAAGRAVYISKPDSTDMRGLWVEVNNGDPALGTLALAATADAKTRAATSNATNDVIGEISVGHGNATIVGYAVNQDGLVSANTSVSQNGSIWLHARDGATMGTLAQPHAVESIGGQLDLGTSSRTEVAVDTADTQTTAASTKFTASAIDLSGNTIHLAGDAAGGAVVRAQGGNVTVMAARNPGSSTTGDGSQVLVDDKAIIDVSGTASSRPMSSNIIPVYLGSNELQDSPLLRDSSLHGQTISVDIRKGTPLLSATGWQSYLDTVPLTVGQRTAAGGSVTFKAGGAVVLQTGATVDVAGGMVNVSAGNAPTSQLTYLGRAIDVGSATPDKPYGGVIAAQAGARNYQYGYFDRYNAGTVKVDAPAMVLRGTLLGSAAAGAYQRSVGSAGIASTSGNVIIPGFPKGGLLVLGGDGQSSLTGFDASSFDLSSLVVLGGQSTGGIDLSGFQVGDALPDALKNTLDIDTAAMAADGFNRLHVNTAGAGIRVSAPVQFAPGGELKLMAQGDVDIDASVTLPGGTVTAASLANVRVADNVSIDVAGLWTNDRANARPQVDSLGRPTAAVATTGGGISIGGTQAVSIGNGVTFDVSGGAWLGAGGALSAGNGGSISIDSSTDALQAHFSLGDNVAFRGYGVSKGGTLEMTAPGFVLGGPAADGYLSLAENWFQQGGFSKYDLKAAGDLTVAAGAHLAPRMDTWLAQGQYASTPSGSMASAFGAGTLPLAGALGSRGAASLSLSTINVNNAAGKGILTVGKGATIAVDPGATVSLTGHDQLTIDEGAMISAPGGTIRLAEGNGSSSSVWLGKNAVLDVSGTATRLWQDASGLTRGSLLDGGTIQIGTFDGKTGALTGGTRNVVVNEGARLLANGTSAVMTTTGGATSARRQTVASAGGTITIDATTSLLFAGSASAAGGNASAAGGTFNLTLDSDGGSGVHDFVIAATAPAGGIVPAGLSAGDAMPSADACGGQGCVLANALNNGGFDWVNIASQGSVVFDLAGGSLALAPRGGLTISAPTFRAQATTADSVVTLTAPYVKLGNANWQYQGKPAQATSDSASATLQVNATTLDLIGNSSLVNFNRAQFDVAGDVRLVGQVGTTDVSVAPASSALPKLHATGGFTIDGSMEFDSAQLYPTSLSEFTLTATGTDSRITFNSNAASASAQVPLSAAGTLTVEADTIDQNGVVRAPLGNIAMTAAKTIIYRPGSLTSVAASATVPLGFVQNGRDWLYDFGNGNTVNLSDPTASNYRSLPDKAIVSTAPDVEMQSLGQSKAILDLSGGGDLYAYQFTAGPGGSKDVLASTSTFAILPGFTGAVAPQDFQNDQSSGLKAGDQVYLSGIAGLPAGYYTLLPAHYALLNGGYAVTLQPGTTDMMASRNYQKLDGSWVVAGYRSYAGGGADNRWSGFLVTPSSLVRRESEFGDYSGTAFLAASGATLPADGGHVAFDVTTLLQLDGLIKLAAGAGGAKGIADISAPAIAIVSDRSQPLPGEVSNTALELATADLAALDADSLVIGGVRTRETGGDRITVGADNVVVANDAAHALTGPEVILAANKTLTLKADSSVKAEGTLSRTPRTLLISECKNCSEGADGALVRVSTGPAVAIQRSHTATDGTVSDPARAQGTLKVEAGANLTASGSMMLDATYQTNIGAPLNLGTGTALTLGARSISFGSDAPTGEAGVLRFDDAAIAALNNLGSLALKSYGTFDIYDPVNLGSATMASLSFAGGGMRAAGANAGQSTFTAKTIRFDHDGTDAGATMVAGSGVTFKATDIEIGNGAFGLHGFDRAALLASNEIRAVGKAGKLTTDNDLATSGRIAALSGTDATFEAGRIMTLNPGSGTAAASSGLGGSLAFLAKTITSTTEILAQAGKVSMTSTATADDIANGLDVSKGAIDIDGGTISAAGGSQAFGSTTAYAPAGSIALDGGAGDVVVGKNAVLDVSAVGADAGTLTVKAVNANGTGKFVLNGTVKGWTAKGKNADTTAYRGGSLVMEVNKLDPAMTFGAVNAKFNTVFDADGNPISGGFTESRNFRLRNDDVVLAAPDNITAHQVTLATDNGSIDVFGTIDARGAKGGSIELYASEATAGMNSGNVTLHDGARLLASADTAASSAAGSTGDGGSVVIGTGTADGSAPNAVAGDASIDVKSGAVIDVANGPADANGLRLGQGGTVRLRAPRLSGNDDVAIAGIDGTVTGSRSTVVEGYKVYSYDGDVTLAGANAVTDGSTAVQVANANGAPAGSAFADAGAFVTSYYLADRLNLAGKSMVLQPGLEVRASGGLTVSVNENLAATKKQNRGWDLSQWRFNGQPIALTLRAGGNLTVNGSISDGFTKSSTAAMPDWALDASGTDSASYRLVAGADLAAANPLATVAGAGDMMLTFALGGGSATDQPVALIRTGTGTIDIAAGRDVVLDTLDLTTGASLIQDNPDAPSGSWANDPSGYSGDDLIGAAIYTAGRATAPSGFTLPINASNPAYGSSLPTAAAFGDGGGAISISAYRNVMGPITTQLVNNWLFRQGAVDGNLNFTTISVPLLDPLTGKQVIDPVTHLAKTVAASQNTAWWSRFDYFDQGVATFGGGDVTVIAQTGNVADLSANVATNAYIGGTTPVGAALVERGGGDLVVRAGGDLRGGVFYVQKGTAAVQAGGAVTSGDWYPNGAAAAPIFALGDAAARVTAGTDLTIDGAFNPMLAPQSSNNATLGAPGVYTDKFSTYSTYTSNSGLYLTSVAGNVTLSPNEGEMTSAAGSDSLAEKLNENWSTIFPSYTSLYALLPGSLTVAALSGDINLVGSGFSMSPTPKGQFDLLARGSIGIPAAGDQYGQIAMLDRSPTSIPTALDPMVMDASLGSSMAGSISASTDHMSGGLHAGSTDPDTEPARVIALDGDLNFSNSGMSQRLVLPKRAEISAGRDIVDLGFSIQNLYAGDVTTVTAGRDIVDSTITTTANGINHWVSGPGRIDFTAGRNFDLGNGKGLITRGNLDNPYLPAKGAAIDIVAGAQPDYARFVQQYAGASALTAVDQAWLVKEVKDVFGITATPDGALVYVNGLSAVERQPMLDYLAHSQSRPSLDALFYQELRLTSGATGGGKLDLAAFDAVIASLFPAGSISGGDISVFASQIKTQRGGAITLYAPGGSVDAGLASVPKYLESTPASDLGVFTIGGGDLQALVADQFLVNQGRVFTIGGGDITLVSQYGDIDAGKGTKTAISAPPPTLTTDDQGHTQVDISSSIAGSGIATLKTDPSQSDGNVYPIAPRGVFNAGDAGLRSSGSVSIVAAVVLNASNISAGSGVSGAAAPAATSAATSGPPPAQTQPKAPGEGVAQDPAQANSLTVELLGYGGPDGQEPVTQSGQTGAPADADTDTDDERKKKSR